MRLKLWIMDGEEGEDMYSTYSLTSCWRCWLVLAEPSGAYRSKFSRVLLFSLACSATLGGVGIGFF